MQLGIYNRDSINFYSHVKYQSIFPATNIIAITIKDFPVKKNDERIRKESCYVM